jgi:hypothetical protein
LIWIDTIISAAGYTKTGDDSDTAAAQRLMSVLSGLSERTGALVIGIDHFGKVIETGTRGSSAKEGHADVVLALLGDRETSGTIVNTRLALRKLREGSSGLELPFTAKDVKIGLDEDDEPETRKVIDWSPLQTGTTDAPNWSKSLQLLRRVLMTMLVDVGQEAQPFLDGPIVRAVNIELVRAEFCKQYFAEGTPRQKADARRHAFGRAIKEAVAKDLVATREIDGIHLAWLVKPEVAT